MRSVAPVATSHPTATPELRHWTLGELGGWDTSLSLRFDEDRIVSDPVLLDSIGEAVESVLGLSLPATVWVEQQTPVLQ